MSPVFTAIGSLLGATVAGSAGAGIGAFGTGVAAAAAAGGAAYTMNRSTAASKEAANAQRDALEAQKTAGLAPAPEAAEDLSTEQSRNAILRRKVHGRTLITGPQGDTLEEEETSIKTLLGS